MGLIIVVKVIQYKYGCFDNYHRTIVDAVYLYVEDGVVKIGRK